MSKDTETLFNEIQNATDIDVFLNENSSQLSALSFTDYLAYLLKSKGVSIAEVQRRGQMTNYIYEIFNGSKIPARNAVLQLCFGLSLTVDEAQKLLRMAKTGALYAKDRRDSILLFGLKEKLDGAAANDLLDVKGAECLY